MWTAVQSVEKGRRKAAFCSVCRKRSPKGGFFVIIDKGEENVSKRNHGKKHELHPKSLTFGVQVTTKMV